MKLFQQGVAVAPVSGWKTEGHGFELGMGPDPTRAYFGYFLTQPLEIYFDPKGEKIEKFVIIWGKFSKPKPKMADLTRAAKDFWPRAITSSNCSMLSLNPGGHLQAIIDPRLPKK